LEYNFERTVYSDIVVETVLLRRATSYEAETYKNILLQDINSGVRKLVVDLTCCDFLDSTFTGATIVSLRKIVAIGGDLRLVGLQPAVKNMFELTRVIRQFDLFQTVEAAVKSYADQDSLGLRNNRLLLH